MTAIFQSNRVKTNTEITSNSKADYLGADPNTSQLIQIICITLNMNNISNYPFHFVKNREIKNITTGFRTILGNPTINLFDQNINKVSLEQQTKPTLCKPHQ